MARKLRLEYPGAVYHVINRGNYRWDIFADDGTKAAFEACLFDACKRSSWVLHGFALMRNHYHLSLETTAGNLIAGMQWFQGTFANRFNRFRNERGHLFQGRYKAILTQNGTALGAVCDYIHLNPFKAGFVSITGLSKYRYSSLWYLHNPQRRPDFMRPQSALACAGGFDDNADGWADYGRHLALVAAGHKTPKLTDSNRPINVCRGWALGSEDFKVGLVQRFGMTGEARAWDELSAAVQVRAIRWETALTGALKVVGKTLENAQLDPKSERWKVAVAAWMKLHTDASNGWLSSTLGLGHPKALSRNLTHFRRHVQLTDPVWRQLTLPSET